MGIRDYMKGRMRCDGGGDGLSIRLVRLGGHLWGGSSRAGRTMYVAATSTVSLICILAAQKRA